jgi:hypothetical protein
MHSLDAYENCSGGNVESLRAVCFRFTQEMHAPAPIITFWLRKLKRIAFCFLHFAF